MAIMIPNDVFLTGILLSLIACLVWEHSGKFKNKREKREPESPLTLTALDSTGQIASPSIKDQNTFNSYSLDNIGAISGDKDILRAENAQSEESSKVDPSINNSEDNSVQNEPISPQISTPVSTISYSELSAKIIFPYSPGCEPDGPAAIELHEKFPQLSRTDIVRYLVARKGNVKLAEEMIEKSLAWRSSYFPLKRKEVETPMKTECFVPFGQAKDGSPIVYMRGGLYDKAKGTPEQFVLVAAHTIEYCLAQQPDEVNVTVIVHTANVPGHPPATADMDFIKLFIKVLSDNYPERLKRLAIFPFPWYGRALWSVCKVFLDKRTQDKVFLMSHSGDGIPEELLKFVNIGDMPECCGGTSKRPYVDLLSTLDK